MIHRYLMIHEVTGVASGNVTIAIKLPFYGSLVNISFTALATPNFHRLRYIMMHEFLRNT